MCFQFILPEDFIWMKKGPLDHSAKLEVNLPTPDLQDVVNAQPIVINDDQIKSTVRNKKKKNFLVL